MKFRKKVTLCMLLKFLEVQTFEKGSRLKMEIFKGSLIWEWAVYDSLTANMHVIM